MSRDPFDEMQARNPVPRDDLPGAPMSMADRIIAGRERRPWPGWAIGVATAALVTTVGFGALWFLGGAGAPVADGGDTTTTVEPGTTTAPVVDMPDIDFRSTVYFFVDDTSPGWTNGPYLIPVERMVDTDPLFGTVQALLDGPHPHEAASVPALSSAIPAGTVLNGIEVSEGVATIDLSADFVSGGGSFSMTGRLAQVVFTLTRLEWSPCAGCTTPARIDGVRFLLDGVPTTVFGGEGVIVDDPAVRAGFEDHVPAILIETPAYGSFGTANPLVALGTANVFEATVSWVLTDDDGLIIAEGFTTATCGTGCRGDWAITIPYEVDAPQIGSLIVWEASAEDGSQRNVREHPVWLVPSDGTTTTLAPTTTTPTATCSGMSATPTIVPQPDLPAAVAQQRLAVWDAAVECDWEQLERLMAESGFHYTYGIHGDPIASWQDWEAEGQEPIRLLAELLNRPFGTQVAGDITYYAWPSVFVMDWPSVGEKERDVLRPLYGDDDFASWDGFGAYIGYRVGITADGEWVYFIAGD